MIERESESEPGSKRVADSGIYAITHVVNGKQYIGSAVNIERRWKDHRRHLDKGVHHSSHLQRAWNKYGADAFAFSVLEYVSDITRLIEREQHYMDVRFAARGSIEYNGRPRAENCLGFIHTAASRQLMSDKLKGRPCTWRHKLKGRKLSAETRAKLSRMAIGRRGKSGWKHTTETRQRMSDAKKGKPLSDAQRATLPQRITQMHSLESRAKALETRGNSEPTPRQREYWKELGELTAQRNRRMAESGELAPILERLHSPEVRAKAATRLRIVRTAKRQAAQATITDDTLLTCKRCNECKPAHLFSKSKYGFTGHQAYCKECMCEYKQERYGKGVGKPAERTHCPCGHPYDDANTVIYDGKRQCRACRKTHSAEAYQRLKARNSHSPTQLPLLDDNR